MVYRRKRMNKKRAVKGRRGGKRVRKNSANNVVGGPNTCKVIETILNVQILENTPYRLSKMGITGPRASAIAPNFGLYRIAKLIFRYTPLYDTYQAGLPAPGAIPVQVPYLYWVMNRYADAPPAFGANYLRTQGAKPNRLDDKTVTIAYKPNILLAQSGAGSIGSQVKMTPWLSTDTRPDDGVFALSTTEHNGHLFFIAGAASGAGNGPVCNLDITVVYEFKNPRSPDSVTTASDPIQQPLMF